MTTIIITVYLTLLAFRLALHGINNRHLKTHGHEIPPGFEAVVDPETLAKSSDYTLAKGQLSLVRELFDSAVTLLFIFGGLLSWYDDWLGGYTLGFISAGMIFFLLLSLAQALLGVPFDLYSHFKLENRFGFNNMTFRLCCSW